MGKNSALITAGIIFMIAAGLHLVRFIMKIPASVGGWEIPLWASLVGAAITIVLGAWMFNAAGRK